MIKFIYICMTITALSFVIVPVGMKISAERDNLLNQAPSFENNDETAQNTQSFEEIYASAFDEFDANDLNNISPAAGNSSDQDSFGNSFRNKKPSAL